MRSPPLLAAIAAVSLSLPGAADRAADQSAPASCRGAPDSRAERPAPATLLPLLGRKFGVAPDVLRGTSYVRCASGRLMGCMVGANLNCGRANLSRRSDGGDAFCHDNPGSDVVPMAATGHDSVYEWHCAGTHAEPGRVAEAVDRLGFMTQNWRPLR